MHTIRPTAEGKEPGTTCPQFEVKSELSFTEHVLRFVVCSFWSKFEVVEHLGMFVFKSICNDMVCRQMASMQRTPALTGTPRRSCGGTTRSRRWWRPRAHHHRSRPHPRWARSDMAVHSQLCHNSI